MSCWAYLLKFCCTTENTGKGEIFMWMVWLLFQRFTSISHLPSQKSSKFSKLVTFNWILVLPQCILWCFLSLCCQLSQAFSIRLFYFCPINMIQMHLIRCSMKDGRGREGQGLSSFQRVKANDKWWLPPGGRGEDNGRCRSLTAQNIHVQIKITEKGYRKIQENYVGRKEILHS